MKNSSDWNFGKNLQPVLKEEIMEILFHRGDCLLLDSVFFIEGVPVGQYLVTERTCSGHEFYPGRPIMPGSKIDEMALQTFSVFIAKNPELAEILKGKIAFVRGKGPAKYIGYVCPGDNLNVEIGKNVVFSESRGILKAKCGKVIARVSGIEKCTIDYLSIMACEPSMIGM